VVDESGAHAGFRAEVREFLEANYTADLRAMRARTAGVFAQGELARRWHEALFEKGWIAPAWPTEYGGPGWTASQREIFYEECARLNAPVLPSFGTSLCGPVIMRFGTPAQKAYFLPRILSNEHYWCQGYSEPGAGSDLASLQTRAIRDGDAYVVEGSKIWTTHAHHANWIFMLVRTDPAAKAQAGITFLITPLDAPGISVRPIRSISGEHELNQVFFEGVRVPVANRLGEENAGWTVAKYLLEFERGGQPAGVAQRVGLEDVEALARRESASGGALIDDRDFRRKAAALEIEIMALECTSRRLSGGSDAASSVGGIAASMKKLLGSQKTQEVTELALEAIGIYAPADQRQALGNAPEGPPIGPEHAATATARYLNTRAVSIFGGASEIQRNILARLALGL
jgi:alkylation response protein AidB-like acyl-CoA dehydrogenase